MKSLRFEELRHERFPGFSLGPVDLTLPPGGRLALIGPSGCGKTTLLRCLAGLEVPSGGRLWLGERLVHGPAVRVPPEERRMGFVFQDGGLWPQMSALEHLLFVGPGRSREQHMELLERVGLGRKADASPSDLSGGETRRLALARALAVDPEILLLDEPLNSIDVHLRRGIVALIRDLVEESQLSLIVVTHEREVALALAEEIVVMEQGRWIEQGRTETLIAEPRTAFGATFLSGATCLPVERSEDGRFETPVGLQDATYPGDPPFYWAVLPGDLAVASNASEADFKGIVAYVDQAYPSWRVQVDVGWGLVAVPVSEPVPPGTRLSLVVRGEVRILPSASVGC